MPPVWIVSGFHRSGTSLLMQVLAACGVPVAGEFDSERYNDRYGRPGYVPNPGGFWGFYRDAATADFPERYAGHAVKLPWHQVTHPPPGGDYRVLFLLRDPAEILASCRRMFGADLADYLPDEWAAELADYETTVGRILDRLRARGDTAVTTLHYRDVVSEPRAAFARLAAAGWPVEPATAAAVVDPALYRERA